MRTALKDSLERQWKTEQNSSLWMIQAEAVACIMASDYFVPNQLPRTMVEEYYSQIQKNGGAKVEICFPQMEKT